LTTKNKVVLTIINANIAFINNQYANTDAHASRAKFTLAKFSQLGLDKTKNKLEKSGNLNIHDTIGIITSSTSDFTIVENAAPITIHIAISIIFHLIANSLNSLNIFENLDY
jgi:hypothetical protein